MTYRAVSLVGHGVLTYYFTKGFVSLSAIAAVCYFSKHLLAQSQQQDTRKRSELCPKLTIKRVESRSGVFIINVEDFSHFF